MITVLEEGQLVTSHALAPGVWKVYSWDRMPGMNWVTLTQERSNPGHVVWAKTQSHNLEPVVMRDGDTIDVTGALNRYEDPADRPAGWSLHEQGCERAEGVSDTCTCRRTGKP